MGDPYRAFKPLPKKSVTPKPHPLEGALARTDRANEHLQYFAASRTTVLKAAREVMVANYNPKTFEIDAQFLELHIPPSASINFGEIIYNLRSALDYLVFELARHDSGKVQNGTQFLIEDVRSDPKDPKRGFIPRSKRFMKGVAPFHIDMIEKLQPYNGVEWTKTLRDVSNPDKHRELAGVRQRGNIKITISGGPPGSFAGRPGKVYPGAGQGGCDVYLEGEDTTDIALPDGRLALPLLELLQTQVTDTINAFKTEFKI